MRLHTVTTDRRTPALVGNTYIYTSMAGKKNTTRGGKRGAKPEDEEDEDEEEEVEEDEQEVEDPRGEPDGNVDGGEDGDEDAEDDGEGGDGMEDRDDGGATAGRIPRDAAVVRDILKSMVRIWRVDRSRRARELLH